MVQSYTLKCKWIVKVFTLLLIFNSSFLFSQSIFTNPITATNPSTANPYTNGQTFDASITVSGIGRGTGITASAVADRYSASGWNSGALDANDYFVFTLTPNTGCEIDFTSFVYTGQVSSAGNPSTFAFRSSLDGFAADIGTPNAAGTTIALTGAAYQNITGAITFRLYGWGAGAAGNTWSVNSFTFNGTVSCCSTTTTITPTTQTVCVGSATALTVTDNATTPTYTWEASATGSSGWAVVSNGTPVGSSYSGINTSTLAITAGSTYYYHCLVSNGTCTSTSATSTLVVNTNPTITAQPTSTSICTGNNANFSVVASGSPLTYQWQEKVGAAAFANITNGGVYSGATTGTLTLTNPGIGMSTNLYQCIISVASCSSVTSTSATLTIGATPAAPPTPTAVANPACGGTLLSAMSSTVSGVTWYWVGQTASGTSTLSPTSSDYYVGETATYYVRAKIDGSSCFSSTASIVVTINQAPHVTSQPTDKSLCVGSNTTFAVSAANATGGYQWQVNNGSGFVNLTNVAPYSNVTTATMSITGVTAGMTGFLYRCVISGASPCGTVSSNSATLIVTPASDPTTAASALSSSNIGCNAFNLSWSNGNGSNRLVVVKSGSAVAGIPVDGTSYASSSSFGSGGTIAAGEFVVYKGTSNSVFITGLTASTTYYYMVFEYNGCGLNYLTSGTVPNGNIITTSCSAPAGITAVYIDACGAGVCPHEGSNELIWGESGSYGFSVNNNGPMLHYNSTSPPTSTMISTYSKNASNITTLNTAVGTCSTTTFVDPNTQGYIPPNSTFLIANNCMCSPSAYDFSGLCGNGPIYVVFGTNNAWPCNTAGGIFGNKSCSGTGVNPRYFDLDFTAWGVSIDPIYSYTPCALIGGVDGDIILTNTAGGPANTYTNSGCAVPLTVLPIELLDFYGTKNGKKNDLVWKVASEINVVYYTIAKSNDGINFAELANVFTNYADGAKTYIISDETPFDDITYYRLGTKEKDGTVRYHKIISVDEKSSDWDCYNYQLEQNLIIEFKNNIPKDAELQMFDLSGQLLVEVPVKDPKIKINTQAFAQGIYFVKITTPYKIENFKIIISK